MVRNAERAASLAEEWDALADTCRAGPFPRPSYALSWWEHLGSRLPRSRLLVVAVRRGEELVGLAPLHERRVGPFSVIRWLGHGLGTVTEALVLPDEHAEETAGRVWAAVLDNPAALAQLVECRDGRSGLAALAALPGRAATTAPRDTCPVVELTGDAAAHLAVSTRSRMRRTLRVAQRRVETAGSTFTCQVAESPAQLEGLLPDVQSVFDAAEAARPRQHLLEGEWGEFTRAYLRAEVAAGTAVVFVGYVDERPVCFDLYLLADATLHAWVGRFDPHAASYSPGHILQAAGLDWAYKHGYRKIDLLLGDVPYKRSWATGRYATLDVMAGQRWVLPVATAALGALARRRERRPDR